MADYIYLLENRLSSRQRAALAAVRDVARHHDLTVFLVGGAVRDLISGAPVRDLDVVVQGNALKLKKDLEKAGGEFSAENAPMQQLHFRFPEGVRLEIGSTLAVSFPKPGKPVAKPTTILEDLRRRDFTANSMALSLNEGSYGLLMDPLNGVADIENRELRLVSNYGFIEDPVRLIRAARLMARLGWSLDEKTRTRYDTAKEENYIGALGPADRSYELEELFHEEDPLRVMQRLEEEGWLRQLTPTLNTSKVNNAELGRLRDIQAQLYEREVVADAAAANFPLLTAKLASKDVQALKDSFPRKSFVREIDTLEPRAKEFATQLASKQAALPSQAYQWIVGSPPVVVLWAAFSSKNAGIQAKFKSFYTDWPQNRQRIPYLLMQEMRITPELPGYDELVEKLFFALMDGKLETPESMRAFLEPFSPPAPPPPVSLRRPRAAKGTKKETRSGKARKKIGESTSESAEVVAGDTASGTALPTLDRSADSRTETAGATAAPRPSEKAKAKSTAERKTVADANVSKSPSVGKGAKAPSPAKAAPAKKASLPVKKATVKSTGRTKPKVKAPLKKVAKKAQTPSARSKQRPAARGSVQAGSKVRRSAVVARRPAAKKKASHSSRTVVKKGSAAKRSKR